MGSFHATERCTCGASITIETRYSIELAAQLTEFRERHRHEPPRVRKVDLVAPVTDELLETYTPEPIPPEAWA